MLGSLTTRLSNLAVRTALTPVRTGIASLTQSLLNAGTSDDASAFARGGVLSGGRVRPFATGGVVAAPTYFPMSDGLGLMGEAGPEAIMPLRRGADGRLGVAAAGGGAGRAMNVTFNVSTPDVAGFRRSQGQIAASLGRVLARGERNA